MKWEDIREDSILIGAMADAEKARYIIRRVPGRKNGFIIRRNGAKIGQESTLLLSKKFADDWQEKSSVKLEGKTYAIRAIKLVIAQIELMDKTVSIDQLDEMTNYANAALDVLEGRVPRFATLPEVE